MFYGKEQDHSLNFHGNSEIERAPTRIRAGQGIDPVFDSVNADLNQDIATAFATNQRHINDHEFGFGAMGGKAAKQYVKGAKANLHHIEQFSPCITMTPEEYEKCR